LVASYAGIADYHIFASSTLYKGHTFVSCSSSLSLKDGWYLKGNGDDFLIHTTFTGCQVYKSQENAWKIEGAQRNSWVGGSVYNPSQKTNNTYDAMRFDSNGAVHSTRNVVTGMQIYNDNGAKMLRYGIYESDANQDYNIYTSCVVAPCGTDEILVQGVNSIEDNNIES